MAMNIIKKERKEITWIGLPTNSSQECQKIEVHTILSNLLVPDILLLYVCMYAMLFLSCVCS